MRLLLLLSAFLIAFSSNAQSNRLDANFNYTFEDLPLEIRFYNVGFHDLLEDHQGYLWMATWFGLARYDGYSIKNYTQHAGQINGLNSNNVTDIFEDSQHNLWIGTTYSGFYRYDRDLDSFEQFQHDPHDMNSLSHNNVWQIIEDTKGFLWIATERGLNKFDPQTNQFISYLNMPNDPRSLTHDMVYSLGLMEDGTIWVGTEQGICRIIGNDQDIYFYRYDLSNATIPKQSVIQHNFIYKIIPSIYEQEVFWVCTSIGLKKVKYSHSDLKFLEIKHWGQDEKNPDSFQHPFVSSAYEENPDQIWVGTYNGLNLLNHKTNKNLSFFSDKNDSRSLNNNYVRGLGKDRCNNLWIGLDKSINKLNLNPKKFQNIKLNSLDNSNTISCLVNSSDKQGLWAGSRGGGLNYLPIKEETVIQGKPQNYQFSPDLVSQFASVITDIDVDTKDGYLWLSTDGAGVFRIKESTIPDKSSTLSEFEHFSDQNQLVHNYVMSLIQSSTGDTWIGYWSLGLGRYDKQTGEFHNYQLSKDLKINFKDFPVVHLIELIEKGQPYLWIGTRGGGMLKIRFDQLSNSIEVIEQYKHKPGEKGTLSNNFINSFLLDNKERLWVATQTGLNLFDEKNNQFIIYDKSKGLKSENIASILEDQSGNIWVSTRQGISKLIFSADSLNVKNFEVFDGWKNNFFMDDAATTSQKGHLVFGGIGGFSIFKAKDIPSDTLAPKIVISDFKLSNQSVPTGEMEDGRTLLSKDISQTKSIQLNHQDKVLSLEFKGLHYKDPHKIQYAYQLKGINPDWVYTDASQRIAQYNNLPYDDFVFSVKAANSDGIWSDPVNLQLTVLPPFWLTNWAYLIYTLLILSIIYLGIRATKIRAAYQHNIELERIESDKIREVNRLKLEFFTNISHELRTPLTLILSPLEQLINNNNGQKEDRIFSRMHHNANRLLLMINQLLDIRKNEAGLMKLRVGKGNVVELAEEVIASFNSFAKQKNIDLKLISSAKQITVWFDVLQLEKVFNNLLSNAFKYTKENGTITVRIAAKEQIEISVEDTGIGIPAAQLQQVFERFFQVDNNFNAKVKSGTGIGLSLTKMIVEKHHGTIQVDSIEGEGASFYIKLQTGFAHFSAEELRPSENILEEKTPFVYSDAQADTIKEIPAESEVTTEKEKSRPTILIVEDNADIRSYLRENLEVAFQIIEAEDGKEGLEKAIAHYPALVIADIAMPIMDGIEMCSKIKTSIVTSHIPVILLTARTSLVFKIDGLETGADDYVTKPFNMQLLRARIDNLIQSRKKLHERFSRKFDISPSEVTITPLDEKLLQQIKIVIEKHIDDSDFTVEKLASALHMTRLQLYRKLQGLVGVSPNKVIRKFRLTRASQLLKTGQYNVSDVTYMVGYNDLKSFRQQFKKEFGVSPSAYSKNQKNI